MLVAMLGVRAVCAWSAVAMAVACLPCAAAQMGLLGIGGFVGRAPSPTAFEEYSSFLHDALELDTAPIVPDGGAVMAAAAGSGAVRATLPSGDWVEAVDTTVNGFWSTVSSDKFAGERGVPLGRGTCPVATLRVEPPLSAWRSKLQAANVLVVGPVHNFTQQDGTLVQWQYFLAPDGNVFRLRTDTGPAVAATAQREGAPRSKLPPILAGRYIGTFYNDSVTWNSMYDLWTKVFGLTCNPCNGPSNGKDFTNFRVPVGDSGALDRIQMYWRCKTHVKFLDNCTSPGLAVGSWSDLLLWGNSTQLLPRVVNPPYRYQTNQGWTWFAAPQHNASQSRVGHDFELLAAGPMIAPQG